MQIDCHKKRSPFTLLSHAPPITAVSSSHRIPARSTNPLQRPSLWAALSRDLLPPLATRRENLREPEREQTDDNDEHDAKHDHNTSVLTGPGGVSLGKHVRVVASDEGEVESRHTDCLGSGLRQRCRVSCMLKLLILAERTDYVRI